MTHIKWIKQLTRENSLLDRAFRVVAYSQSVKEIGKAAIDKNPVVGFGRVTSFYYNQKHYEDQQKIIIQEFKGKNIEKMGIAILKFLEDGYIWGKSQKDKIKNKKDLAGYIKTFMYHHAHGRGAITYSYWGEPIITNKLKKVLLKKIDRAKVDLVLSDLSIPREVSGIIGELHASSSELINKREDLIKGLNLNSRDVELIRILSWFTLLYELGERVSSFLFDELMRHLKEVIVDQKIINDLEWYLPQEIIDYLEQNKIVSEQEINNRKKCYVLDDYTGELLVISGEKALERYHNEFEEKIDLISSKEFKGTPASPGTVTGRVKIVITQDDQIKMEKGDILVSTMTTPRLIMAMKKAAAIITDEGGLTAHAAIVSRELKIPCIVGAKIATRVLKDGDIVEMDANKGIIKLKHD